jgi:hypothetical protein
MPAKTEENHENTLVTILITAETCNEHLPTISKEIQQKNYFFASSEQILKVPST